MSKADDVYQVLRGRGAMTIAEIRLALGCGPDAGLVAAIKQLKKSGLVKTSKEFNPPFLVWRSDEFFCGERFGNAKVSEAICS